MDTKLRSLLERLARDKNAAELSAADFAFLDKLVEGDKAAADGPRPLWRFVRKQHFVWSWYFDFQVDNSMDPILVDAGAPKELLEGYRRETRLRVPVALDALKRSVRRHLSHDQVMTRAAAARLVGLLDMRDAASMLVDALDSGREERQSYTEYAIASNIKALASMEHPDARRLALKYLNHENWDLRRSAHVTVLLAEGPPSPDDLGKVLKANYEERLFTRFSKQFLEAAKLGLFTEKDLETVIKGVQLYNATCEGIADIVVTCGWKAMYEKLLGHQDGDLRTALALRVAWSKDDWAVPMIRARLENEEMDEPKMSMVVALGTAGSGDPTFVRGELASDDDARRHGALLATFGRAGFEEPISKLLADDNVQIKRAAVAALAMADAQPDETLVELAWTNLLNEDAWWPWAIPVKAVESVRKKLPLCADAFAYVAADVDAWTPAKLERALAIYRAHPLQLHRWLVEPSVPAGQRARAATMAGMLEDDELSRGIEQALLACTDRFDVATSLALDLLSVDRTPSDIARTRAEILISETPRVSREGLAVAAAYAMGGDAEGRRRATAALVGAGPEAEPFAALLLLSPEPQVAQAAAEVAAQSARATDPFIADIARLLGGEVRRLADLPTVNRIVNCGALKVRVALAELAALPENTKDEVMPYLTWLATDKNEDVAAAALSGLAAHAAGSPWLTSFVLAQSKSEMGGKSVGAMARIADPAFVPALVGFVRGDDTSVQDIAVRALEKVGDTHAGLGLVVLDVRDPQKAVTKYAVREDIDWSKDQQAEALRLVLLGLDKRKDAAEAKKHAGRKVMITPVGEEGVSPSGSALSVATFDAVALYLRVTYTDEETGSIIAEVSDEASGEVVSAMLQAAPVAVATVAWS